MPRKRRLVLAPVLSLVLVLGAGSAWTENLAVQADPGLIDSGLLRFILPRFALKHNINVDVEPVEKTNETDFSDRVVMIVGAAPDGAVPVIEGPGGTISILAPSDGPGQTLVAWLRSGTGRRTIAQFTAPDGSRPFAPALAEVAVRKQDDFSGDAARGEALAYANCGRCHVIGTRNRMKSIGSTPSFAALRALTDWTERFRTFYLRNPHPAIIQIKDVTEPFDITSPSPIHPVELTDRQVEDILSYAASIAPADLGAPLQNR